MSQVRFLVDENAAGMLPTALKQREPLVDVIAVGMPGAPPRGISDPALLVEAERAGRLLVTFDRKSFPAHMSAHFAAGHHTCGVVFLRVNFPVVAYVDDLLLIWVATQESDWVDRSDVIPY